MKITDVKTFPLFASSNEPISGFMPFKEKLEKIARGGYASCFVEIKTDEDLTGIGECTVRGTPRPHAAIIEDLIKPVLIGENPENVEEIWTLMFNLLSTRGHSRGYFIESIAGVDCALWDLIGKAKGKPVSEILSKKPNNKIKTYASSVLHGKPEEMAKECERLVSLGYDQIKIKTGMGVEKDAEAMEAIRKSVGYDVLIMCDANSAYDANSAIKVGKKLEKYECFWFEEPVQHYDFDSYEKVAKALEVPIAASESLFTRFDYQHLLSHDAVDFIQFNIGRCGGITEARKIFELAEKYGKPVTLHVGLSGAGVRASVLNFASSIENKDFPLYELYYLPNPLHTEIIKKPIEIFKEGYTELPKGPGLGLELDENKMIKFLAK